jgi:hypothetical protein
MAMDLSLMTIAGVEAYLASTQYAAMSIETVPGGHTAFVYRVVLKEPLETGEKTVIIKHSGDVARGLRHATIPGPFKLSAERMVSTFLQYCSAQCPARSMTGVSPFSSSHHRTIGL